MLNTKLLDDLRDIRDDFENAAIVDYEAVLGGAVGDWFGNHLTTHDARLHGMVGV